MSLLIYFILFLAASTISFTIPGVFLISKIKNLSLYERVAFGTIVGFTSFTLLSYLLRIANIHFLLLPIILFINLYYLKTSRLPKRKLTGLKRSSILILLVVFSLGIAGQLAVIAPSGVFLENDLVFWSSHGHDGSWHIALMNELNKGFPLQNPALAGKKLVNYHFFSDIAPADFNKYLNFSSLDLYFRFFPFLFSLLLGSSAYFLGKKMGGSFLTGIWVSIFTFFGGSFGYIATWIKNRTIGGESIFWATQIQSSSGNPPQIISNFLILSFLYFFILFLNKRTKNIFLVCLILGGTLAVFKIYASVVLLLALGVTGFWQLIKEKKINILSLFILSSLLSAALYLPNTAKSASFLILEPWWFIRTMIVADSRLNWIDHELRRQTYVFEKNWKRVIFLETQGFLIFFFGNLGVRFIGLTTLFKMLREFFNNYFNQLFILIGTISLILPLLFLQKGVAGNTIQFFQYSILLFGVLAGITTATMLKSIKSRALRGMIVLLIILLAVPTQLSLLYEFYNRLPFAKISKSELQALNFLRINTSEDSTILNPPYNKFLDLKDPVPNIWDWSDTSYIAAFSQRRTYLADTEQVDIMGYKFKERQRFQEEIFTKTNSNQIKEKLQKESIDYLYFPRDLAPEVNLEQSNLSQVFSNNSVEIWKVD